MVNKNLIQTNNINPSYYFRSETLLFIRNFAEGSYFNHSISSNKKHSLTLGYLLFILLIFFILVTFSFLFYCKKSHLFNKWLFLKICFNNSENTLTEVTNKNHQLRIRMINILKIISLTTFL